jgi:hypothetical protein
LRVVAEEAGDFSGKSNIEEQWIYNILHALQNMYWGDDSRERDDFLADCTLKPTSAKSNIDVLCCGIKGELDRSKSIYISLVPYSGKSDKRTFSKENCLN